MSRKVIFSLLSIPVLAAMIVAVWYSVGRGRGDKVTLLPQEGTVAVRRGRNDLTLSPPQVLKVGQGDQIETGADSLALIVLFSGASVELRSDTGVTLKRLSLSEESSPIVELEVHRGDTWHELPPFIDAETRYEVLTPSASVTLSPARHHITVSDDGSTRVEVLEGMAKVKAQHTEVEVWGGKYTSIAPGRAPAVPRPVVARFLFVAEGEGGADIWLLDEEGREFQLTQDPSDDLVPAWSPDGTRITFETLRDGNSEIYLMNHDGSEQVNLTHSPAADQAPVWSPDGTRIVFESVRDGGRDIYIMNADGSEQTRLTFGPGLNVAPRWSADGQGIVFSRIEGDSNRDGLLDLADMGAFFFVGDQGGTPRAVWEKMMIFEQMIFPWGRRLLG